MRCDMVVAVARATVAEHALFGHNCALPPRHRITLTRAAGRPFAFGEKCRTQLLELEQVRHTFTVVGAQPDGCWGFVHGINEHKLAVGFSPLQPRLASPGPGLLGTDLVRLTLERCRSARQALGFVTGLLQQYGRGAGGAPPALDEHDPAFLLADPEEAFAIEAAGGYWVAQEVGAVRAVSDVRVVRQDWDRIAPGLAEVAIAHQWWPGDGSKLDFAGALGEDGPERGPGLRRWGRATLLLEQQNGFLDGPFLRRVLSDHGDELGDEVPSRQGAGSLSLCQHMAGRGRDTNAASFVAELDGSPARLSMAWFAFGPPCQSVFLPVFPQSELPDPLCDAGPDGLSARLGRIHERLQNSPEALPRVTEEFSRLQARFDQETDEFSAEGAALWERGQGADAQRLAGDFMQHTVERLDAALAALLTRREPVRVGW